MRNLSFLSALVFSNLFATGQLSKPACSRQYDVIGNNADLISICGTGLGIIGIMAGTAAAYDSGSSFAAFNGIIGVGCGTLGAVVGTLGWRKISQRKKEESESRVVQISSLPKPSAVILVTRSEFKDFTFDKKGFYDKNIINGAVKSLTVGAGINFTWLGLSTPIPPLRGTKIVEIKVEDSIISEICKMKVKNAEGAEVSAVIGFKTLSSDGCFFASDLAVIVSTGFWLKFFKVVREN